MRNPSEPAAYIFARLEAQYEAARQAQAIGEISDEQLQKAADRATEAATILAVKKRWVLPFCQ